MIGDNTKRLRYLARKKSEWPGRDWRRGEQQRETRKPRANLVLTCFTSKCATQASAPTPPPLHAFIPINQPQRDFIDLKSIKLYF